MWKYLLIIYTALTWGFISILSFAKNPHPDQIFDVKALKSEEIAIRTPAAAPLSPIKIVQKKQKGTNAQTEAATLVQELPNQAFYYRDSFTKGREWLFSIRETFETNARKPDIDLTKSIVLDDLSRGVLRSAPVSLTAVIITFILNRLFRAQQAQTHNNFFTRIPRFDRRRQPRPRSERRGPGRERSATA